MRLAARRDANEPELVTFGKRLGVMFEKAGPLDWWVGFRGRWYPLEIKTENGVYTALQKRFLAQCEASGLPVWIWRTEYDVMRSVGAKVSA